MLSALLIWCVFVGILFIIHFVRSELRDKRKFAHLERVLALQANREEELTDILDWIKQYRESIRANKSDAVHARTEAHEVAERVTTTVEEKTEELKSEIKVLPEKIAEVVNKEPPSGINKIVPSGNRP